MSFVSPASEPTSSVERQLELLDKADYRAIVSDEDREAVFRLRYQAYVREGAIDPDFSERLSDRYDDLDNTTIYGLFIEGELAASIRVAVATAEYSDFCSMPSFADVLQPYLEAGKVLIDPSRLVTDHRLSHRYPSLLPFLIIRVPWLVAARYEADIILATVRREHQAFYRRIFGCVPVCEPRPYLQLVKPLSLMTCDFPARRDWVHRRYPVFRSSEFERRMLVAEQALPESPRISEVEPAAAPIVKGGNGADQRETVATINRRHS